MWRQGKLKNPDGTPDTEQPDAATLTARALEKERAANSGQSSPAKANGHSSQNGTSAVDGATDLSQKAAVVEVRRENVPQLNNPAKAQHVTLGGSADDKEPKKKKGCCSIM